jgi:hypothetical protein
MSIYTQQAEFLITRGYVSAETDPHRLAEQLGKLDRAKTEVKSNMMTTESVYGEENLELIRKISDAKTDGEKRLISSDEQEGAAEITK